MIHVAKPPRGAPSSFLASARAEMQRILPLFARGQGGKAKDKFSAYRNKDLKKKLEELFHQKCAYCEAGYAVTSYMEVEHYRPKSLYYWLAADWSNLLPSCNRCNNGKRSEFPLEEPKRRARRKGDEKWERPLLLNPSDARASRKPEKHVTFDPTDGSIQAIAIGGMPSRMGLASIRVYRLTRPTLSAARRDWAKRVQNQVLFSQAARQGRLTVEQQRAADDGLIDLLGPGQPFRGLTLKILRERGITRRHANHRGHPK